MGHILILPNQINNVQDAYDELAKIVSKTDMQSKNRELYKNNTKLGDLYIYKDKTKQIQFTPYGSSF